MILLNGVEVEFVTFPNGETLVKKEVFEAHANLKFEEQNLISFKYESDADLIKLMFVKNHLDLLSESYSALLVYYMPYSRMDRSEGGSVFTLKYVSNLINELLFDTVFIVEPHSDVTAALVEHAVPLMVTEPLLDATLNEVQFELERDYVVFPDAGAQKRYAKMFGGNIMAGHKSRDFETGELTKFQLVGGDVVSADAKAIIVDDLCSRGGTPMMTAEALKAKGFKEIYLIVAHCEENIFNGHILKSESPIDKVFTTNSIITEDSFVWDKAQYKDKVSITPLEELIILD